MRVIAPGVKRRQVASGVYTRTDEKRLYEKRVYDKRREGTARVIAFTWRKSP